MRGAFYCSTTPLVVRILKNATSSCHALSRWTVFPSLSICTFDRMKIFVVADALTRLCNDRKLVAVLCVFHDVRRKLLNPLLSERDALSIATINLEAQDDFQAVRRVVVRLVQYRLDEFPSRAERAVGSCLSALVLGRG